MKVKSAGTVIELTGEETYLLKLLLDASDMAVSRGSAADVFATRLRDLL